MITPSRSVGVGIDDDLIRRVAHEDAIAAADSIGRMLPLESTLSVLSSRFQVAPPFLRDQEADARCAGVAFAGARR